jgi:hypothetical protein
LRRWKNGFVVCLVVGQVAERHPVVVAVVAAGVCRQQHARK